MFPSPLCDMALSVEINMKNLLQVSQPSSNPAVASIP